MKIVFDHAEIWPDARKPRQIVLRPSELDDRVAQLAKVLRRGLLEFYFEQSLKEEERTFKPHLTLLRLERRQEQSRLTRSSANRVKLSDLAGLESALPIVLTLDKIALVESDPGKNNAYKILHEVATAPAI
jgi:2'-5' RNA ligase